MGRHFYCIRATIYWVTQQRIEVLSSYPFLILKILQLFCCILRTFFPIISLYCIYFPGCICVLISHILYMQWRDLQYPCLTMLLLMTIVCSSFDLLLVYKNTLCVLLFTIHPPFLILAMTEPSLSPDEEVRQNHLPHLYFSLQQVYALENQT